MIAKQEAHRDPIEMAKHGEERGVRRGIELGASFGFIWVGLLALEARTAVAIAAKQGLGAKGGPMKV